MTGSGILAAVFCLGSPLLLYTQSLPNEDVKEHLGGAAIEGRVLDKVSDVALPNVMVQARTARRHMEAITDSNGRYAIKGIPEGQYVVVAIKGCCGDVKHLSVHNGALLNIDLRLPTPSSVSGHIFSENKTAAVDVTVSLWRIGSFEGLPTLLYQGNSKTDKTGNYNISGLPSGRYYIVASRGPLVPRKRQTISKSIQQAKFRESIRRDVVTYYPGSTDADGAMPIPVKESSNVSDIDLKLMRASTYCVDAVLPTSARTGISVYQSFPEGNVVLGNDSIQGGGAIEVCDLTPSTYHLNASILPEPGKPFLKIAEDEFSIDHEDVDIGTLIEVRVI